MKYRKLELLILSIGLTGVLASIIISLANEIKLSEVLGQSLFVPVLFLALHYGRRYSYLAAVVAAVIYLIARAQEGVDLDFTTISGQVIIMRAVLFGLIGILGGELAVRTKYLLTRLDDSDLIDDRTNVFSHSYMLQLITHMLHDYERYQRPFALIFVRICWPETVLSTAEKDRIIAKTANILRSNVRLADEVGYLEDGRFCLLLPSTTGLAAIATYNRLEKIYDNDAKHFDAPVALSRSVLSLPEDDLAIREFVLEERQPVAII